MARATLTDLHAAVLAKLGGTGGFPPADVHNGDVQKPTLLADGRIQPYAVLWVAPGADLDRPLAGPDGSGEHRLHVTVAGYDATRCLWAADRARFLLDGAWLDVTGHQVGVQWLAGYTAPPAAPDKDYTPWRWFCPLIFTALA